MLPDLSVLLALLLGLAASAPGTPEQPNAVLGTALCMVVGVALTRLQARRGRQAVEDGILPIAIGTARMATLWPLTAWVVALQLFGWGTWVATSVPRTAWMVQYVLLLLPMLVLFGAAWIGRGEIEAALVQTAGGVPAHRTAREHLIAGMKRNAIALLPLLVMIGIQEAMWVGGDLGIQPLAVASRWLEHMPLLELVFFVGLIVLTLPFLPRIVGRMVGATPLPAGPLRSRLEAGAQAINLGYRDILVWNTGGRMLNAMVVGVTRRSRIIFFTDRILTAMPEDELMAVFFHEAGHAKRFHLPLFLVLFITLGLLMYASQELFLAVGLSPVLIVLLHLGLLWFGLLGFVSRRFEREADVFGAENGAVTEPSAADVDVPGWPTPLPAGAGRMVQALERLRIATGGRSASHRHGTLEDRMRYVASYATDEETRTTFRRKGRWLLTAVALGLVAALALVALRLPRDVHGARARMQAIEADEAADRARTLTNPAAAKAMWKTARQGYLGAANEAAQAGGPIDRETELWWRLQAADLAFERLEADADARQEFTDLRAHLATLPKTLTALTIAREDLLFQVDISLGRLAARAGDLPAAETAHDLAARAEQVLRSSTGSSSEVRRWRSESLRLLRATVDGHQAAGSGAAGDALLRDARRRLHEIAGGRDPSAAWVDLRAAATRELKALPTP